MNMSFLYSLDAILYLIAGVILSSLVFINEKEIKGSMYYNSIVQLGIMINMVLGTLLNITYLVILFLAFPWYIVFLLIILRTTIDSIANAFFGFGSYILAFLGVYFVNIIIWAFLLIRLFGGTAAIEYPIHFEIKPVILAIISVGAMFYLINHLILPIVLAVNSAKTHKRNLEKSDFFIDNRDNKKYRIVKIGEQTWMAENFSYAGKKNELGKCYDNNELNAEDYGRLYTWEEAKTSAPKGWHLPSYEEWKVLENFIGGYSFGKKLKSTYGWAEGGDGTDDYGFTAFACGKGHSQEDLKDILEEDISFYGVGEYGHWWTSTENGKYKDKVFCLFLVYNSEYLYLHDINEEKNSYLSVRYIKDKEA